MKLAIPTLDLAEQLLEFDVWITPSLGEVRDTERFRAEMESVVRAFELLGEATRRFETEDNCQPTRIARSLSERIAGLQPSDALGILRELAAVLFLVTGRSDNNAKCQFPLFLRDVAGLDSLPAVRRVRGRDHVQSTPIPRELKVEKYLGFVAGLAGYPDHQRRLLDQFVSFLLNDEACRSQLWSVGRSYFMLKPFGKEKDLLSPLVIFQVRGSVAASGGHAPESMLRRRMIEWGLESGVDFNISDVILTRMLRRQGSSTTVAAIAVEPDQSKDLPATAGEIEIDVTKGPGGERVRAKTRAYDFILPFQVQGWEPRLFVQAQFYAGDSGSVSHKNVDQTSTSRAGVMELLESPRFIEYVDGAGYFSSLNGDLKSLLSMPTTGSFFQVRSASIRLRRELQHIGFLTPIEVEHALIRSDGTRAKAVRLLQEEGYSHAEIERCVEKGLARRLLVPEKRRLLIAHERRDLARRYLLMDVAAVHGSPPTSPRERTTGSLLVPGYGPFHGVKLDDLAAHALRLAPSLKADWSDPTSILRDIRWLCDQGLVISS